MQTRILRTILAVALWAVASWALAAISLDWSTDKEPVSYQPGDTMTFKVQLVENGKPIEGKLLKWVRTGDDQKTAKGEAMTSATAPVVITASLAQPGFVRMEISVLEKGGAPLKNAQGKPLKFEGGAGVLPDKLDSIAEPADFDAFWKAQKAALAQVPMKATLKEIASSNAKFQAFDLTVDCAGGKPVSGCLTVPKDAKPKSLPAQVSFIGYSVCGATPDYVPGTLALRINAHGIENLREPAYYEALNKGELRGYGFNKEQNARPQTCYFYGMMLRLVRALEYIKTRPEWDGRRLTAVGGSQGGFQALAAAALDPQVTRCLAFKPWCCDLGGIQLGRIRGWRPDWADGLGYFDPVNMAKRIRCETFVTAGLGDYVCPPSGISVLYNHIQGSKKIEYIQGSTHGYDPPHPKKQTLASQKR